MNGTARTQSSIAVSTDNKNWLLFNTSPDIRAQLEAFPAIQPREGVRDTGIKATGQRLRVDSETPSTIAACFIVNNLFILCNYE